MYVPPTSIDILYNYLPLLLKEQLCTLPKAALGKEVAIIGSGAAGILCAHELLKMGLNPVIYEARDRMGGRLYSMPFKQIDAEIQPFAEMGAMRIPRSSAIFFHYAAKLGLSPNLNFPNPGETKTTIYFKNKLFHWDANSPLPKPFSEIQKLWDLFLKSLVLEIHTEWQAGNIDFVRQLWQMHINQFKNMSLYQALVERSPIVTREQMAIMGSIGLGHGGFSSLFEISFLEILRLLINGYIGEDLIVDEGISEFINRLYQLEVQTPIGLRSLKNNQAIRLNLPVVSFDYNKETGNTIIVTKNKDKQLDRKEYVAVVFTGSLCALHLLNVTNRTRSGFFLFPANVREAIKTSPMIASSKTYICTETKFWLDSKLPRCILTDDVTRSTYFIDYPLTKYGIVCLSYTWAMDAIKLQAIDPRDRVTIFKRSLSAIYPDLNKYLQPLHGEVLNIDWGCEPYQNGAFRIFTPGNDQRQKYIYLQFLSVLTKYDRGIYLAGDGVSWSGGWVEGALYTALNAVFAVAKRLDADIPPGSPLEQSDQLYEY